LDILLKPALVHEGIPWVRSHWFIPTWPRAFSTDPNTGEPVRMSIGSNPYWIDSGAPGLINWVSTIQLIVIATPITRLPAVDIGDSAPMIDPTVG